MDTKTAVGSWEISTIFVKFVIPIKQYSFGNVINTNLIHTILHNVEDKAKKSDRTDSASNNNCDWNA